MLSDLLLRSESLDSWRFDPYDFLSLFLLFARSEHRLDLARLFSLSSEGALLLIDLIMIRFPEIFFAVLTFFLRFVPSSQFGSS